ncbi:YbhB/YbcL family Raf kinase inhibitor-like protein [Candidatus Woesearchaeota archaeon]|nr:YbhB/YbcL family Raf kinase inhibitor-like protein [Candidatus Woesearchaeota archaeon]
MKTTNFLFVLIALLAISCAQQQEKQTQQTGMVDMKITSSAFVNNGVMPSEFTCDGEDLSPLLSISDVPSNAKSLVLIMDDPDAPVGTWDHWIVFNMPASTKEIPKGTEPDGIAGRNSWGRTGYGGPCPPSGTHRYFFKLYALDTELNLPEGTTKKEIERAMQGYIIAQAQLIGLYKRR